jgi:hypothetical protein
MSIPNQNGNVESFEDKDGLLRSARNDDPFVIKHKTVIARSLRRSNPESLFSFMMSSVIKDSIKQQFLELGI